MPDLFLLALRRANVVLASTTVLVAFGLLAYVFVHNFRSAVARAFVLLMSFATVVYVGDVFLATARMPASHHAAAFWLRFEWIGIAMIAPAWLHFGEALLATTGAGGPHRRARLAVAYGLGLLALAGVLGSELIVDGVVGMPGSIRLRAGPLFPAFAAGFVALTAMGGRAVWLARGRATTERSRRRLTYLLSGVLAPLSVFPYLLAGGAPLAARPVAFQVAAAAANVATAAMIVLLAYAVAYEGALAPDRAVKRDLLRFLIQGPVLGMFVIATIQLVPERLETSLGLPRDVVFAMAVVVGIAAYQLLVRALRPAVDALVFGPHSREAIWLRRLDERLLTAEDLEQLLESILAAMCDRARVRAGYVLVVEGDRLHVDARVGPAARSEAVLDALQQLPRAPAARGPTVVDGFLAWMLHPSSGGTLLGVLAIEDPGAMSPETSEALRDLVAGAVRALEDRQLQQRLVGDLRAFEPELADLQQMRGALERGEVPSASSGLVASPDFPHWVKDALTHYWGGPKLTDSPLLGLRVARQALEDHDYNAARAMRAVLDRAIEDLRPEGERSTTASQWLIYNILELKFVRGLRVRDIARRLSLSESDLYRKQRVAVQALSRQLAAMEEAHVEGAGAPATASGAPSRGASGRPTA